MADLLKPRLLTVPFLLLALGACVSPREVSTATKVTMAHLEAGLVGVAEGQQAMADSIDRLLVATDPTHREEAAEDMKSAIEDQSEAVKAMVEGIEGAMQGLAQAADEGEHVTDWTTLALALLAGLSGGGATAAVGVHQARKHASNGPERA